MLTKILQGKASMQQKVQELLSLRVAAKEQRTASLAGAASSMGGGASGSAHGGLRSGISGEGGGQRVADPDKQLQELVQALASVLGDVSKPEEGGWCGMAWPGSILLLLLCCSLASPLAHSASVRNCLTLLPPWWMMVAWFACAAGLQRLLEQKDNHVFKGLAKLAAFGCTYKDAVAGALDMPAVLWRLGVPCWMDGCMPTVSHSCRTLLAAPQLLARCLPWPAYLPAFLQLAKT